MQTRLDPPFETVAFARDTWSDHVARWDRITAPRPDIGRFVRPGWCRVNAVDDRNRSPTRIVQEAAYGWPFRCAMTWIEGDDAPRIRYGARTAPPPTGRAMLTIDALDGVLPLAPIWPGLMADAVAFGSVWLALLTIPPCLRASRRRRKGLCPSCAYDTRGGAACPECGWIAPRASSRLGLGVRPAAAPGGPRR